MKRALLFVMVLLSCAFICSCGQKYTEDSFFCMDAPVYVKVSNNDSGSISEYKKILRKLENELSRHKDGGVVYLYNESEKGTIITDDVKALLEISDRVTIDTEGAFTAFSGSVTSLWEKSTVYPTEDQIKDALGAIPKDYVLEGDYLKKESAETLIEFGAIAKGYACDRVIGEMKKEGAESGIISFTSSIGVLGHNPDGKAWKIAITDPADKEGVIGFVEMTDCFLSVSGDYERFYEIDGVKYNHIIDMRTGLPVDSAVRSTVVVADNGALSDALSTALFILGPEWAESKYGKDDSVKYLFVTDQGIIMNDSMREIFKAEK